jgi:curved DNA-binding protein CbpA
MGQAQSQIDPVFLGIYQKLLAIQNPGQKAQMIQTILASPEHLTATKAAGIYGHLLHYVQVVQAGGAPPNLPGAPQTPSVTQKVIQTLGFSQKPEKAITTSEKGNEKAMNYFSACLRILGLEEEVALTEETLKGAYKKAVIRAHPDKGGSEKEFEAVTRAHAYLGEILRRIHGGRGAEGKVEAPTALKGGRTQEAKSWEMVKPVALNPNKLDLNAFNKMFDETRIPDPEESGYGDWLKGGDDKVSSAPTFSGKFNRDVFNKMFEDDAKGKQPRTAANAMVVQEMSLASRMGYATELGRGARDDYTVTSFEGNMAFTDLKKAYTEYNTFSHETAGVAPVARTLQEFESERKAAPAPLRDHEMEALRGAEEQAKRNEDQRKLRMAQSAISENDYFERMKRLVIRNN